MQSPPEVFLGKGVLKIYSKFAGERPCQGVISIGLYTSAWVFPCKFAAYFQNAFPGNTSGVLLLTLLQNLAYGDLFAYRAEYL